MFTYDVVYLFTTSLAHTVYDAKLDAVRAVLYASLVDIVKMLQENRAGGTGGTSGNRGARGVKGAISLLPNLGP